MTGKEAVARERYEDLCEYFNNNPHTIELILNDRKEFKAWLDRMHWHVLECEKLARKLEALEGKDNAPDTNVGDIISRHAAIDLVRDVCDAIMSGCESWYDPETEDEVYKDIREVDAILKCNKEIRIALRNMPSVQPNTIPMDWIQRYADDWEDMNYAYENPILGMLEDWRREQDE